MTEGPILIENDPNLFGPTLFCAHGEYRCKHLNVNDWHYFYCGAQHAENCDPATKIPYPWRGAGKRLDTGTYRPDEGCPFKVGAA